MKLYSNEIVFRGHPDKVCDQISDALLDAHLEQDPNSRCAIEVMGGGKNIFISGEVTSKAVVDIEGVIKRVIEEIGYEFEYHITNNLGKQSPDIALGTNDEVGGAGDNGMMFGYAINETKEKLPTAQVILQKFAKKYDELVKENIGFKPDGKAQITGYYGENMRLEKIKTFTICYQNLEDNREELDELLKGFAINLAKFYDVKIEEFLINPTGRFVIGGFEGDAGLTGRKIVVDNYQSFSNVGGGAFSGKDASKVDRSGAYKAREVAKRLIEEKDLYWCEIQVSYAIGKEEPLAIYIVSDLGNLEPSPSMYEEFKPKNIIKDLWLKAPNFEKRARFGHFED